jgi:hypothetical protein
MDPVAPILLALLVALAIALAAFTGRRNRFETRMRPLLTEQEMTVYTALQTAFGDNYSVYPKVAAAALFETSVHELHPDQVDASRWLHGRSVDFLICEKGTVKPVAGVLLSEHADSTGDRFYSAARSAFFAADIPVYEIDLAASFSTNDIASRLNLDLGLSKPLPSQR